MGGGRPRRPLSAQQKAAMKAERERQRKIRLERARARQAIKDERDAWIKAYRAKTGEYGWGALGWPLQWWREKRAWEEELEVRANKRIPDTELEGLIATEGRGTGVNGVNGAPEVNGVTLRKRTGVTG
jgi:hypothetical protein